MSTNVIDNTQRFSDRAEYYAAFRGRYSELATVMLADQLGLCRESVVADIGSGTGHSSRLFLPLAAVVYGIEPNEEMRRKAERELSGFPNFKSTNGTAEATTLPDAIADFVVSGSSFHWFDRKLCLPEFRRILRKDGYFVVLSNRRRREASEFMRAYDDLFKLYAEPRKRSDVREALLDIFGQDGLSSAKIDNSEHLDCTQLTGRVLSYSSMPLAGHPRHEAMLNALTQLFECYQANDKVLFEADTIMYWGKLK